MGMDHVPVQGQIYIPAGAQQFSCQQSQENEAKDILRDDWKILVRESKEKMSPHVFHFFDI